MVYSNPGWGTGLNSNMIYTSTYFDAPPVWKDKVDGLEIGLE